jgi:hypothetical protein
VTEREHPPHRTWNVDEPALLFGEEKELEMAFDHDEPIAELGSLSASRSVAFWLTWALILILIAVGIVLVIVLP